MVPLRGGASQAALLPDDWSGAQAGALFHERHDAWRPADRRWKAMSA
ncbi:hypothetical protein [Actinomadura coerulea]